MPKVGEKLSTATETYEVTGRLGGGGSGDVYSVRSASNDLYAVKVLRSGTDRKKLRRFKNEMMFGLTETLSNVIKVVDFGLTKESESFFVMPLASGTLRSLMNTGIEHSHKLPLFSQMLDGVEAAHLKGVIHRDLKPENVLAFGTPVELRIADFGIAHFQEDALHTQIKTLPNDRLANWEYAAPEQRRSGGTIDKRADIYSLGLILAELFTGQVPHGLGSRRIADSSPDLAFVDEISESMRQQEPDERPESVRAVKEQLIARHLEFVEAQKLDQVRKTVVKDSEVTDVLINNPPSLMNVTFRDGALRFELSREPNTLWIETFYSMVVGGVMGYGPEAHKFFGKIVSVHATDYLAQNLINQFKGYLNEANRKYEFDVRRAHKNRIAAERNALVSRIAAEEARIAFEKKLTW